MSRRNRQVGHENPMNGGRFRGNPAGSLHRDAGFRTQAGSLGYPLTSGPARSIEILTMTRRSRSMAARYSAQSGCSPAVRR